MGFSSCNSCFVCDNKDLQGGTYLTTEKTSFSNIDFPTKIWQLIGEKFLVIVNPSDQLCINCTFLINKSDKLETKLLEIRAQITSYLSTKYNLDKEIDEDCSILSDNDLSKEESVCRKESGCQSPIEIEDSNTSGICSDLPLKREGIEDQESNDLDDFNSLNDNQNNINIKKEPVNCTFPTEFIGGDNQHTFSNLSSPSSFTDFVSSDPISCEQLTLPDVFCGMEVQNSLAENLGGIKKEIYLNYDSQCSLPRSPSEDINQTKISDLNCESTTPNAESNSLDTDSVDKNCESDLRLFVTKQEKNTECCEVGSDLNASVSGSNFPKLEKPRQVVSRNKHRRVYNGYQRSRLRPILPKLTNVLHSYCVLDLDTGSDNLQPSVTSLLNNEKITQPNYPVSKTAFTNKIDIKPTVQDKITTNADQTETSKQFQCRVCSLGFEDLKSFKIHKKVHGKNINAHECSICKRVYKTRSGLQNHQATHTGKYAFYCEVCGAGFMTRWSLQEHSGSHTKEGRYVCHVCGKKFSYQSSYWIHKKWHENPLPYKCGECGRLFKHSSLLANHRRSKHLKERPYKCSFCSASFAVSNSLKRHEILHTKKYPFTCENCQQGFTTRFKYSEHLAKAHRIILDKAPIDKKDLKVAVHSEESAVTLPREPLVIDFSQGCLKDANDFISSYPDFSDSIVKFILDSNSVLSNT